MKKIYLLVSWVLILSFFGSLQARENFKVHKKGLHYVVKVHVPIPSEVKNQTQARALSREAGIVLAQTELYNYIDRMKVKSGLTAKIAQVAYLDLRNEVKTLVQGAHVKSTKWKKGKCYVKLGISKRQLKSILKKY